jgi:hypothetical protein
VLSELKLIGWALGAAAVLGVFWWVFHLGAQHEQAARQEATIEQQRIDAKVSQQRVEDQAKALHDAELQSDAARIAADRADRARGALLVQIDTLRHARPADPTASSAIPAIDGGDPIGVLADVLGRSDARASIVDKLADERRIRAEGCERSYDSLSVTP